jgi:hypothetical protein
MHGSQKKFRCEKILFLYAFYTLSVSIRTRMVIERILCVSDTCAYGRGQSEAGGS